MGDGRGGGILSSPIRRRRGGVSPPSCHYEAILASLPRACPELVPRNEGERRALSRGTREQRREAIYFPLFLLTRYFDPSNDRHRTYQGDQQPENKQPHCHNLPAFRALHIIEQHLTQTIDAMRKSKSQ
jgi:hypothetical protein